MRRRIGAACAALAGFILIVTAPAALTQPGGKGFPGGPGGPGGFGPGGQERKVVKDFDKNGDGWLNDEERKAARESVKKDGGGFGKGGFGPKGFGKGDMPEAKPGPKVTPADVRNYRDSRLYEPAVLRTVFLEFTNSDW